MELRCRFHRYPVDYTRPVDYIPWDTFYIPWVHAVDTPYPVGYSRGLHISRGHDIPWTTCSPRDIMGVVHGMYVPWVYPVGAHWVY